MKNAENFGILASMSWNSTGWEGEPTNEDLKNSGYSYVQDEQNMYESVTFGHNKLSLEDGDYYIGYSPVLFRLPDANKSRNVKIIFLFSTNKNESKKYIVGFYGFPEFGWSKRYAEEEIYKKYIDGNIKSHVNHIIRLNNYVEISDQIIEEKNFLPPTKKLGKQGFNYLDKGNVKNILKVIYDQNKKDEKLKKFLHDHKDIFEVQIADEIKEILSDEKIQQKSNDIKGINELENIMIDLSSPIVKERVSKYIERGAIANKIKKLTNYKCLICSKMGETPYSFRKKDGEYYIETHHVIPVSEKGSLGIANLITLCANHHRQMHYGNVELLEDTEKYFKFKIDGKQIIIEKIKL